ncbi:amino acid adenylation domain-containing protein [Saccharothrix ecbatanensis]|uniref:Amino acid adenylation domain-containing protein n=1 Tax=Saccharothrix ecbatanensis TaxID=1105145 RepID=A0A7W9HLB0_9PSEU|nr:amino acid adenylation domain-containing protein [Saccharothrix ecbatanensis]MBB5803844.1 amino acid adenylation domain-containing protein [Saccharothrix ecbatanensis]
MARARPDAVALVHGGTTVRYGELDRAADGHATRLAALGVGRGDVVPVLLPRSATLITTMLGILKVGAAYALLDVHWPDGRVQEVLDQLDARLVVASAEVSGRTTWTPPATLDAATLDAGPADFEPVEVDGGDPCCVFFTSGTTGRAKCVLTPHRAIVRLFRPGSFARFDADTVVPQAAPQPWDGFALELWSVLLSGGTSLLVDEPYLSAQTLRDGVARHGVDTAWITSSLFNMIVDEDPAAFRGMGQVMIGGERLSAPHVRRFLAAHPDIVLLNGYGPVESTVFATTHRISAADCDRPTGIPIGRPVPDTQVHVLDGTRPCEVGETGELCVAGDGLAIGYLGADDATAEKFVEVTIDGVPTRVYRTGDTGWWDADGLLHYAGRRDRQVKVRGHRVEPAEIERQVERALGARRCVVLPRRDAAGTVDGLVAFCVPAVDGDPLVGARDALSGVVVHYHLPDVVLAVAEFPLTGNGKLDEDALLALVPDSAVYVGGLAGEQDPLVVQVARVFAAVLDQAEVSPDVAFTALGGTSLGAGRVCARLAAELGRPVPVSRLLGNPTARALAGWLRSTGETGGEDTAPPVDVPLSPMQVGFLTRHLLEPDDRSGHCLGTWIVDGDLDRQAMNAALARVHHRHEALRAAYSPGRKPFAKAVDVPAPELTVMDEAPSVDAAVSALRAELRQQLDLRDGRVWRAALVPLSGQGGVFGYVVHHIAFDGWSEAVFARDLAAAYRGGLDHAPGLADTWSLRQDYLRHADLERQRAWAKEELRDLPQLVYPVGPDAPDHEPGRVEEVLTPADVAVLDAAADAAGVTRFVALLAAYGRALAELSGQDDFAVGVPVAQRADHRLHDVVGCHVDLVCVRLRGDAGSLTHVGDLVRRAFEAQDVGFGEVVRLVNPPRSSRTPLFQNLFAYQDNTPPDLPLDDVATRFLRQPYLGLPTEVQTDVWPTDDGGLRVVVGFLPAAVAVGFADDLAKRFADLVRARPETPEDAS